MSEIEIKTKQEMGSQCVYRYQVIVDHSSDRAYIVVDFAEDGVILQDVDFEWPRFKVSADEWSDYEAITASDDTPVFGY